MISMSLEGAKKAKLRHTFGAWVFRLLWVVMVIVAATGQELALEGTIMFLHVWKCGGTSMRQLMCDWAKSEGLTCATVAACRSLSLEQRKICLVNNTLILPEVQGKFIAQQRVIAGHFRWGFQAYAVEPHLLITTLRNPLELFVSGEQYLHRKETSSLLGAKQVVSNTMLESTASNNNQQSGFLHRFVGRSVMSPKDIRTATVEGARNMNSFWLVGVVEQYAGFISVLSVLLDTSDRNWEIWENHLTSKSNTSPISSTRVLAEIDPQLIQQFNSSLSYQWLVYGHAVRLFETKCQEVMPESSHSEICHVPTPPAAYI